MTQTTLKTGKKLCVLYVRVSTLEQNIARQTANSKNYDLIIEDKCSGAIAFADRVGGAKIIKLLGANELKSVAVTSIDRLGRNLKDLLITIEEFNKHKINIDITSQGLRTLNENGTENSIAKLIISILGTVGEMERNQIRERQAEGIAVAKAKGMFLGRKLGTVEDNLKFLSKPKNKRALEYLRKETLSNTEISKIVGLNINTITKIKKLGFKPSQTI